MTQNINGSYAYAGYDRIASWEASSDNPPVGKSGYARGDGYAYSESEVKKQAINNAMYFEPQLGDRLTLNGEKIELFQSTLSGPAANPMFNPEMQIPESEIPKKLKKVGIGILLIPIAIIVILYFVLRR